MMDSTLRDTMSNDTEKPTQSYIALIATAILSKNSRKMLLSEIYSWIVESFPYYKGRDRSWRNSVRHNLSLNECFVKSGRGDNGKGNYWSIHPANMDDFLRGDFRRRRARRRVRKASTGSSAHDSLDGKRDNSQRFPYASGYTIMKTASVPVQDLIQMFGVQNVLSAEERQMVFFKRIIEGINTIPQSNPYEVGLEYPGIDANNNTEHSRQPYPPQKHELCVTVPTHTEFVMNDVNHDAAPLCEEMYSKDDEIERWHDTLPEIKLDDDFIMY
ncbi:unnamed protein product [Owenia fusiformis]|uniref:Uncharacterized protein n=1 Tax=Owenia fusiformis TaxID=6347 RepID=A0A8J1TWH3_OWEFU|nr:unnamed protein product [Owenia fusiformis]